MRDSFPFLTRLGLQPDSDAKDIRRAYARELKKIDQAADPGAFQELRESYEIALGWHAYQQVTPEDCGDDVLPAPRQAEVLPTPEDPRELADRAFEEFIASIAAQEQHSEARRVKTYKALLLSSLESDRLLNLTARILFEARIVGMFASGSNPGREALFAVANEVFDWERDRRRIGQFGEAGAMVSQAVDELRLFQSLPPYILGTYKQLLGVVHANPIPAGSADRSDLLLFHKIVNRFHAWLTATIDHATLKNWIEASLAESQHLPKPARKSIWADPMIKFPIAIMLMAIVMGFFNLLSEARKPKGFYPPADMNHTQEAPGK